MASPKLWKREPSQAEWPNLRSCEANASRLAGASGDRELGKRPILFRATCTVNDGAGEVPEQRVDGRIRLRQLRERVRDLACDLPPHRSFRRLHGLPVR